MDRDDSIPEMASATAICIDSDVGAIAMYPRDDASSGSQISDGEWEDVSSGSQSSDGKRNQKGGTIASSPRADH